jgi:hypothetical protein
MDNAFKLGLSEKRRINEKLESRGRDYPALWDNDISANPLLEPNRLCERKQLSEYFQFRSSRSIFLRMLLRQNL